MRRQANWDETHLSAYHDEMLDGARMSAMKELLNEKPEVRKEFEDLCRTVVALRRLPDPEPPEGFWDQTVSRLRELASDEAAAPRAALPPSLLLFAGIVAAGLLLAAVGYFLY